MNARLDPMPPPRDQLFQRAMYICLANYGDRSREIADDNCDLFRNNVIDHVPCAGHRGEDASLLGLRIWRIAHSVIKSKY